MEDILASDDLLSLILREEAGPSWCCPPLSRQDEPKPTASQRQQRVVLRRALRFRIVSKTWYRVVEQKIQEATSFDLRGIRTEAVLPSDSSRYLHSESGFSAFDLKHATEILIESMHWRSTPPEFYDCKALTALSLRDAMISDTELSQSLLSLREHLPRIKTLSLAGCSGASGIFNALGRDGRLSALTAFDLSGCKNVTNSPLRFEKLLQICPRLQRLDLSHHVDIGAACLGSVCLVLASTLTHLNLSGCGLTDSGCGLEETCEPMVITPSIPGVDMDGVPPIVIDLYPDSNPLARQRLWTRLTRLKELSLADNPRLSAKAICALLTHLPSLHSLDLSESDYWPSETAGLLTALCVAPNLRWIGLRECGPWLDPPALRTLQGSGNSKLRIAASPDVLQLTAFVNDNSGVAGGASGWGADTARKICDALENDPKASPLDCWEEVEAALDHEDEGVPAALCLPSADTAASFSSSSAAASSAAGRTPFQQVDYDVPARYRQQPTTSIYHVSYGERPLYGGGSVTRTQTDAHGLRS